MERNLKRFVICTLVVFGAGAAGLFVAPRWAQTRAQAPQRIELITDWSHRHMIFSAPDSTAQAWRLQSQPRYAQQQIRRNPSEWRSHDRGDDRDRDRPSRREEESTLRPDWGYSQPALPAVTTIAVGNNVFPAKYTFDITAAPSCANDFVIYPSGVAGSGTKIAASATGVFSSAATLLSTITITNGPNTLTMTAGITNSHTGTGTGTFSPGLSGAAGSASNLATALNIAGNGSHVGISATSAGATVTITASTGGTAGNSITLAAGAGFLGTHFTWNAASSATLEGGADGTASIAAYNNLYVGTNGKCTGPTAYWNYDTAGGSVVTSPVLSADGSQVAFVQTVSGMASLVVLKWSPSATFATLASDGSYPSCTVPCMISVPFRGSPDDTTSSPFYVYAGAQADTLYVGDSGGKLHKFHPVFSGTPAEVTTSPWPITVDSGAALTSPVYDSGSGNVFVADGLGNLWYVRESNSSVAIGGSCASGSPPCLGTPHQIMGGSSPAIIDGPIVDGTSETVYVFNGSTAAFDDEVLQTDTALGTLRALTFPGNGANSVSDMRIGDFDNAYYVAAKGSGSGKLYVCAKNPGFPNRAALFRVGFTATAHGSWGTINVLNAAADGTTGSNFLALASASGEECSPITEAYNTAASTDWLFLSVGNNAATPTACSTIAQGCIMSLNLTALGATWPPGAMTAGVALRAGPQYLGGNYSGNYAASTSPIIIDNVASTSGAGNGQFSNIYFFWLTNASDTQNSNGSTFGMCNGIVASGGCAVKLTQSALQ